MADTGEVDPEAEIYTTIPLSGIVLSKISWNPNTDCAHCGIQNRKPRDLRPFKPYGKEARVCRADDECAHRWRKREEFREANRRQQIAEEAEIAYRRAVEELHPHSSRTLNPMYVGLCADCGARICWLTFDGFGCTRTMNHDGLCYNGFAKKWATTKVNNTQAANNGVKT